MCPYEEKLTAWLLGDLRPDEQEAVTRHLSACASCRAVRDEIAAVLTPLNSGLAKDKRLFPQPAAPRRVPAWFHAPWVRAAALFVVSFGTLFALFGLIYNAATRTDPVGPVTTFTFLKPDQPPEPLEPLAPSAETADVQPMTFEPSVFLPLMASISIPEIPVREYNTLPHFFTLSQIALGSSATNAPLIVYNDLLAQQLSAAAATNANDTTPLLHPSPPISPQPRK